MNDNHLARSRVRSAPPLSVNGFAATGAGIVWAVLSSGIHARHLQFDQHQNLTLAPPLRHRDFTSSYADNGPSEMEALVDVHGTRMAGIIVGIDRILGAARCYEEFGVGASGHWLCGTTSSTTAVTKRSSSA